MKDAVFIVMVLVAIGIVGTFIAGPAFTAQPAIAAAGTYQVACAGAYSRWCVVIDTRTGQKLSEFWVDR